MAAAQLGTAAPGRASTIIFIDDSIDIEIAARFNASKRYSTLNAAILNNGPIHSLSRIILNGSISPITLFSRQTIFHQQGTLQDNSVLVVNSGAIDPAIGINAQITNQNTIQFLSFADDSNIDLGIATVSLGQRLTHYQDHLLANAVLVRNSGALTAGQTGIAAGVTNRNFAQFFTDALNNNTHLGVLTVDLSQTITLRQRSRIMNVLSVTNSGDIDAGANGIQAEIVNSNIALFRNRAASANVSAGFIGRNLSQSLSRTNRTEIDSIIAVDNTGNVQAGTIGVGAAIETSNLPELQNTTYDRNSNTEDLTRTISQSLDIGQEHEIGSALVIENAGDVTAGGAALAAEIVNTEIDRIENTFHSAHINDNSGNAGRSLTQSLVYDQSNVIDSAAVVSNSGVLSSGGGYGIAVEIENSDFTLIENSTDQTNQNSGTVGRNLTQTSSSSQYNGISNLVAIDNAGTTKAGQDGIAVAVENANILLSNVADITNDNTGGSVGGDLTQSIDLDQTNVVETSVLIANTGKIDAGNVGIAAEIENGGIDLNNTATLTLSNAASVSGSATQSLNVSQSNRVTSEIVIANSGAVKGGSRGIYASIQAPSLSATNILAPSTSISGANVTTSSTNSFEASIDIENTGSITADNLFAIETEGASTTIYNHSGGTIAGYIKLSDEDDSFENGAGGIFYARATSDFGGGDDVFINRSGGLLQAARALRTGEVTNLVNLETFVNEGQVSVVDGGTGDILKIAGTGPESTTYRGQGHARLSMDVFLRDDGSSRDQVIIDGQVLGRTQVVINNTNLNSGIYNPNGILIIFATGETPDPHGFHMDQPVDAGFFDYDLFFVPTGSGYWELKSFAGGGARMLPQLMTAAQDAFHITNQTWFDRSADLRVLLHRQQAGAYVQPNQAGASEATAAGAAQTFMPAVWVKGGGAWTEHEDSDTARAYGRTYAYDLNRELDVANMQIGLDFGTENVLSEGDMVVFGVLGGVNLGELDYHAIHREFDLKGGEFGAYATYLKGNLFVDTLLKGQHLSYDANGARGFPESFDSISWGARTDAGYRFGGYSRGPFVEPLATMAIAWTDLEDLSNGGNTVDFKDNESVRGRLGLRLGTTYEVWENTIVEPFVIGSYWKDFTDSNETTLVSVGQTFDFYDSVADSWGEISAGVNLFNPDASTAVFAKTDFIFGDGVDGVAGRAGIRVNW